MLGRWTRSDGPTRGCPAAQHEVQREPAVPIAALCPACHLLARFRSSPRGAGQVGFMRWPPPALSLLVHPQACCRNCSTGTLPGAWGQHRHSWPVCAPKPGHQGYDVCVLWCPKHTRGGFLLPLAVTTELQGSPAAQPTQAVPASALWTWFLF